VNGPRLVGAAGLAFASAALATLLVGLWIDASDSGGDDACIGCGVALMAGWIGAVVLGMWWYHRGGGPGAG
jgi:hypothetical protein